MTVPVPAAAQAIAGSASTVRVRFEVRPADAEVSIDGRPTEGREALLSRDSAAHGVDIRALGHEPRGLQIVGDVDRVITIDLLLRSATSRGAPARQFRRRPARSGGRARIVRE